LIRLGLAAARLEIEDLGDAVASEYVMAPAATTLAEPHGAK
jgi:hypothetical protein